jgi:SAM-dependent methyltransferase
LRATPSLVLDLGCGPVRYASRLAALGHLCLGIDYSPASIRYARERAAETGQGCTYVEGDLRQADFGRDYDLAMLLYGELNVFSPDDALWILCKERAALRHGGRLLLEPHPLATIEAMGARPATWWTSGSGLFAEAPHVVLTEHVWNAERRTATLRTYVVDAATAAVERHAQTFQGYHDEAYRALLARAGFEEVRVHASLTGSDGAVEAGFIDITARAATSGAEGLMGEASRRAWRRGAVAVVLVLGSASLI